MTGKTITAYLEEYRAKKSFSLVQSGQYSMTQIAALTASAMQAVLPSDSASISAAIPVNTIL